MSYDLYMARFEQGAPAPMASERFWESASAAWRAPPDDSGFVRLVRKDGEADVYAGPLGEPLDSVMINHFGGDEIMDLIVQLARGADAVLYGPGIPPLLTRAEQRGHLPADLAAFGEPILLRCGRHLAEIIETAA